MLRCRPLYDWLKLNRYQPNLPPGPATGIREAPNGISPTTKRPLPARRPLYDWLKLNPGMRESPSHASLHSLQSLDADGVSEWLPTPVRNRQTHVVV